MTAKYPAELDVVIMWIQYRVLKRGLCSGHCFDFVLNENVGSALCPVIIALSCYRRDSNRVNRNSATIYA